MARKSEIEPTGKRKGRDLSKDESSGLQEGIEHTLRSHAAALDGLVEYANLTNKSTKNINENMSTMEELIEARFQKVDRKLEELLKEVRKKNKD